MKTGPHPKEIPILLEKKNNSPIDVISANRTPQINKCELVRDTDQQFNDITLRSQNTPVIRSTRNMLSHTEDTPNRYNNSKTSLNNLKLIFLQFLNSKTILIKSSMKLR